MTCAAVRHWPNAARRHRCTLSTRLTLPLTLPCRSAPQLATPTAPTATSARTAITLPSGVPATAVVRLEACPTGVTQDCPSAQCSQAELAQCAVDGLSAGTEYGLAAVLLLNGVAISARSAAGAAKVTPLHP